MKKTFFLSNLMKELKSPWVGPAIFVALMILILISTLPFSPLVSANASFKNEPIVINIEFNTSDLSFYTFENYDIVKLKGYQLKRDVGEPALPMKSIYLVIPPKARITDIEILSSEKIAIEGEYLILPAQPPVSVSTLTYPNETKFAIQNASLYSSSNIYPGEIFRYIGEGNLRGYRIVCITIFPIQYVPVEKKLIFYKNITLRINYTTPQLITTGVAVTNGRFDSIIKNLVPSKSSISPSDEVKYVIITNESLKDAFLPLADWKTKKGVPAKIVTVSSIEANYSGNDTQEKIRNFMKDVYTNWSTEWILLGGDTDVVPCRGAYGYVSGSAASSADEWWDYNIPADLYYSDLDGNWDANGNLTYGEVNDSVDLYPDVFVGRAPVNTIAEVQTFVNKTLTYEKKPPLDYELDMLFLAEHLSEPPKNLTEGGVIKNMIDDEYIPPKYDPITKKYEMYGNASQQIAINEMNDGPHIVNHAGHGYYSGFSVNGWVSSGDADSLTNYPKNFILYSISCMSNGFDDNSVSEHYMNNPDGGTVAYIGNSRYGFFIPGQPGDGPSDLYDQQFFNSLFNDNFYHIGETVAYSKVAYIADSEEDGNGMRWLQYAINLLGDPELPIWTDIPQNFTINKPSAIPADTSQEIVIHVLKETEPVQNATVCIMKDDDGIYSVSETDSSGNVSFSISPSAGALNVTVTKHNFVPNESLILVVDEIPPTITVFSPVNGTTYNTSSVSLNYTVNEVTAWEGYSLDGAENVTINGNTTLTLMDGMHNLTVYANDIAGNMGASAMVYFSVDTTPPASITNLTNTTGNFWIKWTWTNPLDIDFNHTMVYIDVPFNKTNTSNEYYSLTDLTPHATRTISTHTVDTSGNINSTWENQTTTIPNNKPVLEAIGDKRINENEKLTIDANAIDLDSDTLTYSCNRTDLFADFNMTTGKGNWTPSHGETGIYYVDFGVADGYEGMDNETVKITINDITTKERTPAVTSSSRGGGGGGGGPISNVPTDSKGVVRYTVTLTSRDENALLKIPKGTTVLDAQGNPLTTSICILRMPLEGTIAAYDLRQNGVKFNPPIEFTINYDPAKIPEGTTESDLVIKMLENGTWTLLETAIDMTTHTATTKLSHFTVFALFAEVVPAPTPEVAPMSIPKSPEVIPTPSPTPGPTPTPCFEAVFAIACLFAVAYLVLRGKS